MNALAARVGSIALTCAIIGFGALASAQNQPGTSTKVDLMTGPDEGITVTLPPGTTRPDRPHDWARLLFRRLKEGAITPKQALLAIAWLPASNRSPISGLSYLEISTYLSGSSNKKPRAVDPDSEDFDLSAGLVSLGSAIVPSLQEAISEDQPLFSKITLSILEGFEPLTFTFVASGRVILLLDNPDPSVRRQAAKSLTMVNNSLITVAIRALRKSLSDAEMSVRAAVAVTLTRIDPASTEGVNAMLAELQRPGNRRAAAFALAEMGERAASAGQTLIKLMGSGDNEERLAAISALGSIGSPIVSQVITLLDVGNEEQRMTAVTVLLAVGKPAVPFVVERLSKIRDSKDSAFMPVLSALIGLGEHAVPALIDNLKYRAEPRAVWSAFALGKIGPPAMSAVPALMIAARGANFALRREATDALKKIQIP